MGDDLEQLAAIMLRKSDEQAIDILSVDRTQHGGHGLLSERAIAKSDRLISQTERIPHTSFGGAAKLPQCGILSFDAFTA